MFREMMANFEKWLEENKEKLEQVTNDQQQTTNVISHRPSVVSHSKVGRNDPCPCGSSKKYKKCHGGYLGNKTMKYNKLILCDNLIKN